MKRRGNREGSIVQRADGRWSGAIRIAGQPRRYVYSTTREGVQKKLRALLSDHDSGHKITSPTRQKFSAYLHQWLEYQKSRVRPNTYKFYSDVCELHIIQPIGDIRLTALEPYDIERVLIRAREKKLSARSVSIVRQVMFMALKKAVAWEKLKRNPAASISGPKRVRSDIHPLDEQELLLFLDAIKTHDYHALFLMAVSLGLRKGELLGLKWSDVVDPSNALTHNGLTTADDQKQAMSSTLTIQVRRTLQGKLVLDPKTESSKRDLRIPPKVLPVLKAWRAKQLEWRLKAGEQWIDDDWMFSTHIGSSLDRRNLSRWYAKILRAAKIPHHRFHDLRHTCATMLLRAGAKLAEVSALLGHASRSITLDTYYHAIGTGSEVATLMDSIITG